MSSILFLSKNPNSFGLTIDQEAQREICYYGSGLRHVQSTRTHVAGVVARYVPSSE